MSLSKIQPPSLFHMGLILVLALVWGSSFTMIKFSVEGLTPLGTAFGRLVIGFFALLPYALYRGWRWPRGRKQWCFVLMISFLGNAFPFLLIAWAETRINAGLTSLILATVPLFALGLSHFLTTDDRINRFKVLGLCMSATGLFIVFSPEIRAEDILALLAILAVLGAAFCYAASGAILRFMDGMPPTRLCCLTLGLSSLMLIPFVIFEWQTIIFNANQSAFLAVVYLGLIPTAFANIIRYYLIPRVGLTWFSQSLNLIPIFGILFGALLLDEAITDNLVIALVMVLSGLWISRIKT